MMRSCAGALLDPNREVRNAVASCFASLARRNAPEELTRVITERLLRQDADFRTLDDQRNSFRVSLARALSEVCRRCDDSLLQPELKGAIAAKAFGLRWSDDKEVETLWESLWGELCPTTTGGVAKYHQRICQELSTAFEENISRAEKINAAKSVSALAGLLDKQLPRPNWAKDDAFVTLHKAVLTTVQVLPMFEGNGTIICALAEAGATMHRRSRNQETVPDDGDIDETVLGLPLIKSFICRGALSDRAAAARALLQVASATRLWPSLDEIAQLHRSASDRVDELQRELEQEKREPGEAVPKRHRGKGQSPAEDLLSTTLDLWTTAFQQCRREVEDECDLEPPEASELQAFMKACIFDFEAGSLSMRLNIVRYWKHVFSHFAEQKLQVRSSLGDDLCTNFVAMLQSASLDQRSERLRRPAFELAAALANDCAIGGGKEVLVRALASGVPSISSVDAWIAQVDGITSEQCSEQLAILRSALGGTSE